MTITLSVTATTTTTATFGFANMGASGTVELQISPRDDFQFCVCPVYPGIPRATPYTHPGLNQRCTYFARARTRLGSGLAEPWSNVVGFRTADGAAQVFPNGGVLIEPALVVKPEPVLNLAASGAGGPTAGFPASNLVRDAPVGCRIAGNFSVGLNYFGITFERGGAQIDTAAILNTNFPEDSMIRIYGTDNPDYQTGGIVLLASQPFRASPNLPGRRGYHGVFRFAELAKQYITIEITSPTLKYAHIEHLVVGKARVSKNFSTEKTEQPVPQTSIERRRSGIVDRQKGYPMRKVDFDISAMSETQYETLYGDLHLYQNEPVLVVPNTRANAFLHDRILYGDLSGGRVVNVNSPIFTRGFTVESLI